MCRETVETFLEESVYFDHKIENTSEKKIMKSEPIPLTTSRLQQKASNDPRQAVVGRWLGVRSEPL